jgi:hypothetical protein
VAPEAGVLKGFQTSFLFVGLVRTFGQKFQNAKKKKKEKENYVYGVEQQEKRLDTVVASEFFLMIMMIVDLPQLVTSIQKLG